MSRMFPRMDGYVGTAGWDRVRLDRRVIEGAPGAVKGLRVVFASDFHLRRNISPEPVIECIGKCRADLILFGGDFADRKDQALRLFGAFGELSAPMGIFAVCGNNDTEAFGSCEAFGRALERCGVRLLVNESARLGGLEVAGVDEHKYGRPAYEGLFSGKDSYRVLISHYPVLPEGKRPELMLAGHTHGGQFNAFGLTPFSIGFEQLGDKRRLAPAMVSGFARFGSMDVLVSKGVGISRLPLRIGVRPEIHLLEFN